MWEAFGPACVEEWQRVIVTGSLGVPRVVARQLLREGHRTSQGPPEREVGTVWVYLFLDVVNNATHLNHFHLHGINIDHHGHERICDLGLLVQNRLGLCRSCSLLRPLLMSPYPVLRPHLRTFNVSKSSKS